MTKEIRPEHIKQAAELLKKEHSERLRLEKLAEQTSLEKRAQRIAFREVELGVCEPFRSFDEFSEKVAALAKEDLDVVEKALERGYTSGSRLGGELVGDGRQKPNNPLEHFVLTGELVNE